SRARTDRGGTASASAAVERYERSTTRTASCYEDGGTSTKTQNVCRCKKADFQTNARDLGATTQSCVDTQERVVYDQYLSGQPELHLVTLESRARFRPLRSRSSGQRCIGPNQRARPGGKAGSDASCVAAWMEYSGKRKER